MNSKHWLAGLGLAALTHNAVAAELEVTVQNLTGGIYFTPLLITAHSSDVALFTPGEMAGTELQAMAEGGDIAPLQMVADGAQADSAANPAGGLLGPTVSTSAMLTTNEGNTMLSIVAMLLPTNDGFVGLNSWPIPQEAGTYHVYLKAYDAGTEANDELRGSGMPGQPGMPVPPPMEDLVGMNGSGVTSDIPNSNIHIHPGNLGDDIVDGGISDIDNTSQRWLNPVAKVTIVVSE